MSAPASLQYEDAFYWYLGRLTQAAAALDAVVSMAIQWLEKYNGREADASLFKPNVPFAHRLTKLSEITKETFSHDQPEVSRDFSDWFERANKARALRNNYVHARWGLRLPRDGAEPDVEYIPLQLGIDPTVTEATTWITFSEFNQYIEEFRRLHVELNKLYDRHSAAARPAAPPPTRRGKTP
ncbi:MAG: hypothetical protein O9312_03435 [Hylemonella sp.]|nr:hypothetical protein [Hylemonella sp.]